MIVSPYQDQVSMDIDFKGITTPFDQLIEEWNAFNDRQREEIRSRCRKKGHDWIEAVEGGVVRYVLCRNCRHFDTSESEPKEKPKARVVVVSQSRPDDWEQSRHRGPDPVAIGGPDKKKGNRKGNPGKRKDPNKPKNPNPGGRAISRVEACLAHAAIRRDRCQQSGRTLCR